jgi:hypothetical protein
MPRCQKNAGIIILAGKRDFVKKMAGPFFWREIQIVRSRRISSVVGNGSTLYIPAKIGKASVCLKK